MSARLLLSISTLLIALGLSLYSKAQTQEQNTNDQELLAPSWEDELNTSEPNKSIKGDDLLEDESWSEEELNADSSELAQDSAPATNLQQIWNKYAKLQLEHNLATNEQANILLQRSTANLQLEASVMPSLFISVKGRLRYYNPADEALVKPQKQLWQTQLQHGWLQFSQGAFSAKLGKQKLVWGRVDGAPALDVITPFDATEQLLTDLDSLRLSQTMGVFNLYGKNQNLSLFYTPQASFNRLSLTDLKTHFKRAAPHAKWNINEYDAGQEFGARYQISLTQWDLAVMGAHLIHNNPVAEIKNKSLELNAQEYDLLGISSSYALSAWLINTDVSIKTKQVFLSDKPNQPLDNSLEFAFGVEYVSNSQHSLKAGLYTRKALKHELTEKPALNASWSKNYWNDHLALSALLMYQMKNETLQTTALTSYKLNDIWKTAFAYSLQSKTQMRTNISHTLSFSLSATF